MAEHSEVPTDDLGPEFVKGHGTQNDFIILPDSDARLRLTPARVAALCDRRRGIGADGVLRVARAGALVDAGVLESLPTGLGVDDWFMDYRNGDGSIAEMCGNGVRVFAHYLKAYGRVSEREFAVGSRAGVRPVVVHAADAVHAEVTVRMGTVTLGPESKVHVGATAYVGVGVDVGNPHLACVVEGMDRSALARLPLPDAVDVDARLFPFGANVELLTSAMGGEIGMRVIERGVGETRSCGTGTVAAAVAALRESTGSLPASGSLAVHVPGGTVHVEIDTDDGGLPVARLRGPSELVASGRLSPEWANL